MVLLCVFVLFPTGGWTFTHDAEKAIKSYVEDDLTLDQTREGLALKADEYRNENDTKLGRMFLAFQIASLAVGASVVLWLIDLN